MSDKQDPEYWLAIKPGDFVSLTDYQSIALVGSDGKDYRVRSLRAVEIPDKERGVTVAQYSLFELAAERDRLVFFVTVRAGEESELRVYFLPRGFSVGTRDHLIDLGQTWFFLPPPNPDDFISSELEYAPYPDIPPIEENGTTVQREYGPTGFGHSVYGYYGQGDEEVPVIITEYATSDQQALNPLLLVLEERWILPDGSLPAEGGLVTPLLGCVVDPGSVETYPA